MNEQGPEVPAEVGGRHVRRLDVDLPAARPGEVECRFWVLEAADPEHVLESAIQAGSDPYAAIAWPAALAVAAELPGRLHAGERVLDLGTGTGLCALAAAALGARVLALDHDAVALRLVTLAAGMQGLTLETELFDLDGPAPLPYCDLAILADVLYEPALARAAARRTAEVVRSGGRVVVGDPARFGRATFLQALDDLGLEAVFGERWVSPPGSGDRVRVGVAWIGG